MRNAKVQQGNCCKNIRNAKLDGADAGNYRIAREPERALRRVVDGFSPKDSR